MKNRKLWMWICYLIGAPALVVLGAVLWRGERYALMSMGVALITCIPFFLRFEKQKTGAREIVVIAMMTAIAVVGRLIFAPLPAFKPVSALVIIAGTSFGPMAGFMTGSMSALISNLFFGQGPWTPFQMLLWGLLGFLSGLLFCQGRRPRPLPLCLVGALGGFMYSLGMDVYTVLSTEGAFAWDRYLFYAASALPVTAVYAVSNVIFLLLLARPLWQKTQRLRVKYGVFCDGEEKT